MDVTGILTGVKIQVVVTVVLQSSKDISCIFTPSAQRLTKVYNS